MLNQICGKEDIVDLDQHKHECQRCGTCFKHSDDVVNASAEDFDEAHTCPGCGQTEVTKKIMDFDETFKGLLRFFG